MSRLRGRSHSSTSSLSTVSETPLTPSTAHSHSYRQLTLVPQMKSVKPRSPHTPTEASLTRAASLASTRDIDADHSATATVSSSQPRKQKTLDSFLVPKTQQLTAEQRRQQRRERKERRERTNAAHNSRHRTAAVTVDVGGDEEDDARQQRLRKEAEARERARALKEERMDSEDEEDIPLFRIAPPALPSLLPAPSTPSSSSQSQSSLPSSLSSSAIPASPVRRLKDEEDDDEWDQIPSFVLQPQQRHAHLPTPRLSAVLTPYQPPPLASTYVALHPLPALSARLPPPPPPPPAAAAAASAAVNPFAQSTSSSLSSSAASVKAEWDDAPRVRLPLSQMLQSLSEAKAAVDLVQKPSTVSERIKREHSPLSLGKENAPPPAAPGTHAKPITAQRARPPSPSSPPPLEAATQRDDTALQRHSSITSEQSIDSISSVEVEGTVTRPDRVKRERAWAQPDDIEDEGEPQQQQQHQQLRQASVLSREALFASSSNASHPPASSAVLMPSAGQAASSFFSLPPPVRSLHQPQPLHPHSGLSPLLASPPPASFHPHQPSPPLSTSHNPLYAGRVESWPLAFPQAEDEHKQPAGVAGSGYSFRGISELQGQAAINYGSIFQPKPKRKRRDSEQTEDNGREVRSDSKQRKKKQPSSKRRKSEANGGAEEGDDELAGEEGKEARTDRKKGQKKRRSSGRWCTVNGQRCYIVGGRRLIGSAAYMAYRKESGESSSNSSKKEKKKKTKTKATKKGSKKKKKKKGGTKKEGTKQTDGSDSGEEEWQPGHEEGSGGEGSGGSGGSGDESAGSLAEFIVDDDFIEPASSDDN